MELVDGLRLDQVMDTEPHLKETRLLEIGIQVAEGLEAAHEIGLVHSDIKPANIIFTKKGIAKVVNMLQTIRVGAQLANQRKKKMQS